MPDDLSWLDDHGNKASASSHETWFDARPPRDLVRSAHRGNRDQDVAKFLDDADRQGQRPPRSSVGASPVIAAIFAAFPGAKITKVNVHDKRKKYLHLPGNVRVDL